jgi:predicted nucleic acid-binding protein
MPRKNLVDAGPIIAYLDKDDLAHDWATGIFSANENLATCEAVISEACARLEFGGFDQHRVIRLVTGGILTLEFSAQANIARILRLMEKYADRPMDFADACLVVMTEESSDPVLFTLDNDFKFYRRHGRDAIPFVSPKH